MYLTPLNGIEHNMIRYHTVASGQAEVVDTPAEQAVRGDAVLCRSAV